MRTIRSKDIQRELSLSKIHVLYWMEKMNLEPVYASNQPGIASEFNAEDVFSFLLCQRLFHRCGLQLQTAGKLVEHLVRKLERGQLFELRRLWVLTMEDMRRALVKGALYKVPTQGAMLHVFIDKEPRALSGAVAKFEINLEDLRVKAIEMCS